MSRAQKSILVITAFVLVVILLYPPFHKVGPYGIVRRDNFSFLFTQEDLGTVDVILLATELSVCIVVGGLIYYAMDRKN